jgi:hypothetical protein
MTHTRSMDRERAKTPTTMWRSRRWPGEPVEPAVRAARGERMGQGGLAEPAAQGVLEVPTDPIPLDRFPQIQH